MASAALSRRCLELILEQEGGSKKRNLSEKIDEVAPSLPGFLGGPLHAVREVGNFAAHSIKNTNTGEIVRVEEGEAEFNLEVLEGLFDHYFVKPAKAEAIKNKINEKLVAAGRKEV